MSNTAKVVPMPVHQGAAAFDVERVRADFPILATEVYGKPLVYLDNGASAQKPRAVIDAMTTVMETGYSNVHRGVHRLSQVATDSFEAARKKAAQFINARSDREIIFTRGATEAINLVAASYGRKFFSKGDEIIVSHMEHHSNIVPWQLLCEEIGAVLKVVPIDDDSNFLFDEFQKLISKKTKLVAVTHVSNALGTVVPVKDVIDVAHAHGAVALVDGCQAAPHMAIDVQDLDADFYTFSGHKVYGPTGVGVLYGKEDLLNTMPPYQGGGDMIASVSFEKTTFQKAPHRFEAGTPAIVEVIGFGAALDYISEIGLDQISAHEQSLLEYATEQLRSMNTIRLIGTAREKASIISFVMDGVHAHDVGTIVDRTGIAIRVGHHCAEPVMQRYGVAATARASFGLYNTHAEVDKLIDALQEVKELFG